MDSMGSMGESEYYGRDSETGEIVEGDWIGDSVGKSFLPSSKPKKKNGNKKNS